MASAEQRNKPKSGDSVAMNSQKQWCDVTSLFRTAAQQLAVNNPVHPIIATSHFSLAESMHAVELMDPIMDHCYGITGPVRTEELLQLRYPYQQQQCFSLHDTILVLQAQFISEVSFLSGASLLDSISRCAFNWDAFWPVLAAKSGLGERVSLAFSQSLVLSVGQLFRGIKAADIFEDEDFQPAFREFLFDQQLQEQQVTTDVSVLVVELMDLAGFNDAIHSAAAANTAAAASSSTAANTATANTAAATSTTNSAAASTATATTTSATTGGGYVQLQYVLLLLQCRHTLYMFYRALAEYIEGTVRDFSRLMRARNNGNSEAQLPDGTGKYRTQCVVIAEIAERAATVLQALIDLHQQQQQQQSTATTAATKATASTATTTAATTATTTSALATGEEVNKEELIPDLQDINSCSEISFAFNSALVKLHQVHPIRRIQSRNFSDSIVYLRGLCQQIAAVCRIAMPILEWSDRRNSGFGGPWANFSFENALAIARQISEMQLPQQPQQQQQQQAHLLSRSLLVAILHTLSPELDTLLLYSMQQRGVPQSLLNSELVQLRWLLGTPLMAAWDSLKAFCCSRSQLLQRTENVLSLWGTVGKEAMVVDSQFEVENGIGPAAVATTTATTVAEGSPSSQQHQQQQAVLVHWCSLWAVLVTVQMMDLHMGLLVELQMLLPCELDFFYWYWDYICATAGHTSEKLRLHKYLLDQAVYDSTREAAKEAAEAAAAAAADAALQSILADEEAATNTAASNIAVVGSKKKKKSKKKSGSSTAAVAAASESATTAATTAAAEALQGSEDCDLEPPVKIPPTAEEFLLHGRGHLARGLFRVMTLCKELGITRSPEQATTTAVATTITTATAATNTPVDAADRERQGLPLNPYSSVQKKFARRFKAFKDISSPPLLSYADFLEATNNKNTAPPQQQQQGLDKHELALRLLSNAANSFQTARSLFEEVRKSTELTQQSAKAIELAISRNNSCSSSYSNDGLMSRQKFVNETATKLTKLAVASAVAAMKSTQRLKSVAPASSITAAIGTTTAATTTTAAAAEVSPQLRLELQNQYHAQYPVAELK